MNLKINSVSEDPVEEFTSGTGFWNSRTTSRGIPNFSGIFSFHSVPYLFFFFLNFWKASQISFESFPLTSSAETSHL